MQSSEDNEVNLQERSNSSGIIFYIMPVISLLIIFWTISSYSPLDIGPVGILGVFSLIYIFSLSIIFLSFKFTNTILIQLYNKNKKFNIRKNYYLASALAFMPVFLLALNSIGQLKIGDFLLVFIFIGLACFYIFRRVQ